MSLSGSSASRYSIWAITRFASSSSMKVGRKMMRSLRRREKMSNARSPRGVCSTTIGTRAIGVLLFIGSPRTAGAPAPRRPAARTTTTRSCFHVGVGDEQLEGHSIAQPLPEPIEVTALLHHTPDGRRGPLTGLRQLLDLGVHIGVGGGDGLLVGDGLEQEGAPHRLLGVGPELADQLLVVPGHPLRVDPLP